MKHICKDHEECELRNIFRHGIVKDFKCTKKSRIATVTGAEEEAFCNSLNADMKSICEDNEACELLRNEYGKTSMECVKKPFYKKSVSKALERKIKKSRKIEKYFFKREWSPCFDSSGGLCKDLKDQVKVQAMYAGIPTAAFIVLASIIGYFYKLILHKNLIFFSIHHD